MKSITFKEIVAAALGALLVALAVWFLYDMYHQAATEFTLPSEQPKLDAYNRRKDILSLVLGFLGTVTGYYFGRVPAEKHAETARDAARRAEMSETRTRQDARGALLEIQKAHNAGQGVGLDDDTNRRIHELLAKL